MAGWMYVRLSVCRHACMHHIHLSYLIMVISNLIRVARIIPNGTVLVLDHMVRYADVSDLVCFFLGR